MEKILNCNSCVIFVKFKINYLSTNFPMFEGSIFLYYKSNQDSIFYICQNFIDRRMKYLIEVPITNKLLIYYFLYVKSKEQYF